MPAPYLISSSTVVPVSPDVALQGILDAPLEQLFPHRSGPIPPIVRCEDQVGAWGTVGQTRRIVLGDGGASLETLAALDPPGEYRYRVSDFEGAFKLLVTSIDGRFTFHAEGAGTRATWSWAMHPTNPVARLALPGLKFFWQKWAAAMWPRYEAMLVAA